MSSLVRLTAALCLLAPVALAAAPAPAIAQQMTAPSYPETRRDESQVETLFGEQIADPYRWLEDDVRNSAEVADWVERQNAVTDAYLAQLPGRDWFRRRAGEIFDFARYSTPYERGRRYF